MDNIKDLRHIFEADQAGLPPRSTLRQSHDQVLALLATGLRDAEATGDRATVRIYCHLIDHLKTLYPSIYPSWHQPSSYWRDRRSA